MHCPVGAVLVVVLAEDVELELQVRQGRGGRLPASQRFWVWWNLSPLPWVWGWKGWPFFWVMPRAPRRHSKALRPLPKRAVQTRPLNISEG